jgi:hypothetical protein
MNAMFNYVIKVLADFIEGFNLIQKKRDPSV